jgi:hypothetical protein
MVLGIVVGIALGLLLVSTLVVQWLGPAWVWFTFFPPILPALLVFAAWQGAKAGRRGRLPAWGLLRCAALALILWPICMLGPYAVKVSFNRGLLRSSFEDVVPVPADATLAASHIDPLPIYEPAHIDRTYRWPRHDDAQVLAFYQNALGRRGWLSGPTGYVENAMQGTPHWYAHREICFFIGLFTDSEYGEELEFSVRFEQGSCDWI